jgi:aryl-alcohol dehydrogenase-like predicted oxidoreductase
VTAGHGLVLGSAQWGLRYGIANQHGMPSPVDIQAMTRTAADAGVDTIDTARAYGSAEAAIGALGGDWRVVTKLAPDVAGAGVDAAESRRRAQRSLAASREALGRDHLDAVLLHRDDHRQLSGGSAWSVLLEERQAGRIGAIGCSVVDVADAPALLDDPDCDILQVPASLLDRRLADLGFFERAQLANREVFVRSVYLQGVAHLDPDALPDHLASLRDVLASIDEASRHAGIPRWELFLIWARDRGRGARVIVGVETVEQIRANLTSWARTDVGAVVDSVERRLPVLPDAILDPWRWPAR